MTGCGISRSEDDWEEIWCATCRSRDRDASWIIRPAPRFVKTKVCEPDPGQPADPLALPRVYIQAALDLPYLGDTPRNAL